ncbi:hypothetical protein R1sor_014778 [Riccia sorocarpa]|uniref:Plastid lipid-associated protein/fibrillin conserved domain-containing protein n=1 Tax=Riccia sorocarpa TaxID=122646 RepID=A0ABD3HD79_9MARC
MASTSAALLLRAPTGLSVSSPVSSLPSRKNASVGAPCLAFSAGSLLGSKIGLKQTATVPVRKSDGWAAGIKVQASATAQTTNELQRYSLKEDLVLAIKDAGGLKGLTEPKADASARIDVNEKILAVERLNPTPRPTTSPLFEGKWEFLFAGAQSPGLVAAKILLKRFPSELASLTSLLLFVDGENAKATGTLKLLNSVESNFTLTTKLAVEGPLKLKEEYVEGIFTTPTVPEGTVPVQIKGLVDQIAAAVERLPIQVKEVISGGVKVPLGNTFSRELLISYLDEDMLIVRDKSGIPDVLVRTEVPASEIAIPVVVPDYES